MRNLSAAAGLLALAFPLAALHACGGTTAHEAAGSSTEAGAESGVVVHRDASAGGADGGADDGSKGAAEAAADAGYVNQAPHCTASDAGIPPAFSAGAIPALSSLAQVENSGGSTLHHPTFVSVTFPNDPYAAELADFVASVGCTDWWHAVTADYGVGDAVAGPPVALTESAPTSIDDTGIRSWLAQKIESGDPQFPEPTGDIIYVVWYPETTTITLQGLTSCQGFDGYHEGGQLTDGTRFSYAVLPRCPTGGGGGSPVDYLTLAASHEIVEGSTDPQPDTAPAFAEPDTNHMGWLLAEASEVGDLCEYDPNSAYLPPGYPWYVQLIYSNSAAAAGTNPCVPAASPTYFYGAPLVADTASLDLAQTGTPVPTAVAHVAVGTSVQVPVKLVGSAGVGAMQVQAYDIAALTQAPTTLGLTLSAATGSPGDTLTLTIDKQAASPQGGVTGFVIVTQIGQQQTFQIALTTD